MKLLSKTVLWFLKFDLAIARSTGQNRGSIINIAALIHEWELILWNAEHRMFRAEALLKIY